ILDEPGAERLLGRGDMLFRPPDASRLERVQGTFLNDEEISRTVRYWKGIRSIEGMVTPTPEEAASSPGNANVLEDGLSESDMPDLDGITRNRLKSQPLSQPTLQEASQPLLFEEI